MRGYEGNTIPPIDDGYGEFTYPDDAEYKGEWKNHQPHGQGTWMNPNGDEYVGEFKDGYPGGWGTYVQANDGRTYTGYWKNNKIDGFGKYQFSDGGTYEGFFEEGAKTVGKYTWPDGSSYSGEWGKHSEYPIVPDNPGAPSRLKKRWRVQSGYGTMTFADGSTYTGYWKDGKQNGQGTYIDTHFEYVGEWLDGQKHGQGTKTYPTGTVVVGEFKHDNIATTQVPEHIEYAIGKLQHGR